LGIGIDSDRSSDSPGQSGLLKAGHHTFLAGAGYHLGHQEIGRLGRCLKITKVAIFLSNPPGKDNGRLADHGFGTLAF
jgi:hypothetical protein